MGTISKPPTPVLPEERRECQGSSKLVQMRFRAKTLERLDDLHEITGIENRTQIVAASIQLAHLLAKLQESGGRVVIEHEDGQREVLAIVGL
jgi:hypothetical protein